MQLFARFADDDTSRFDDRFAVAFIAAKQRVAITGVIKT